MPHRSLKKNILRNVRDQPLHFLWAGASVLLPFVAYRYLGLAALLVALVLSLASIAKLVHREWRQFPSHDVWDFWLDTSFYGWGAIAGATAGILLSL